MNNERSMLSKENELPSPTDALSQSPALSLATAPWPYFAPDEMEAAACVMRSGNVNYWTGEEGMLFEKEFAMFLAHPTLTPDHMLQVCDRVDSVLLRAAV